MTQDQLADLVYQKMKRATDNPGGLRLGPSSTDKAPVIYDPKDNVMIVRDPGAADDGTLTPLLGLSNEDEWYDLYGRLREAIRNKEPLSDLDWARALFLTEISFGSDLVGSGLDLAPSLDGEMDRVTALDST